MSRPSFQFYPGDWQKNAKLRFCSHGARGAWIDVLCLMHCSDEYGVLRQSLKDIALAAGAPLKLLKELVEKGVIKGADKGCAPYVYKPRHAGKEGEPIELISTSEKPCWYCSRMVRDEFIRQRRGGDTRFDSENNPQKPAPKAAPNNSPKGGFGGGIGDGPSTSTSSSTTAIAVVDQRAQPANVVSLTPVNRTAFAQAVAGEYGKAYGVSPPPVPLMLAMEIAARAEWEPRAADLSWWADYFATCWEDLFLTNRDSLECPLGPKAATFKRLVSEECMADMIDRSRREAAHG